MTTSEALNELAALLQPLTAEQKIALACNLLGRSESQYEHLDRGRKAMTGGNLLRNAVKADPHFVVDVRACIGAGVPATSCVPRPVEAGNATAAPATSTYVVTEADVTKWEKQAAERDAELTRKGVSLVSEETPFLELVARGVVSPSGNAYMTDRMKALRKPKGTVTFR